MPINKTKLIKYILNSNAYLYSIKLPFDKPIQVVLEDILQTVTLPIFSTISPIVSSFSLNTNDLTRVRDYDNLINTTVSQVQQLREEKKSLFDGSYTGGQSHEAFYTVDRTKTRARDQRRNANVYFLPDEITRYNLIDILSVTHDRFQETDEAVALTWYRGSLMELVPSVIDTIAYSSLIGAMGLNEQWEFIPPNMIKLVHLWDGLLIRATFEHRNLQGISQAQFLQLSTLFNYDVRMYVWNLMNSYNDTIGSAYGMLNLKLDFLANAESERMEYINKLNDQLASSSSEWIDFL